MAEGPKLTMLNSVRQLPPEVTETKSERMESHEESQEPPTQVAQVSKRVRMRFILSSLHLEVSLPKIVSLSCVVQNVSSRKTKLRLLFSF